jgi:hypothetical protein
LSTEDRINESISGEDGIQLCNEVLSELQEYSREDLNSMSDDEFKSFIEFCEMSESIRNAFYTITQSYDETDKESHIDFAKELNGFILMMTAVGLSEKQPEDEDKIARFMATLAQVYNLAKALSEISEHTSDDIIKRSTQIDLLISKKRSLNDFIKCVTEKGTNATYKNKEIGDSKSADFIDLSTLLSQIIKGC